MVSIVPSIRQLIALTTDLETDSPARISSEDTSCVEDLNISTNMIEIFGKYTLYIYNLYRLNRIKNSNTFLSLA
jgi:hypothetical protein